MARRPLPLLTSPDDAPPKIGDDGVVPVVLTKNSVGGKGSNTGGYAGPGVGVIMERHAEAIILAHELAHSGTHVGTNQKHDHGHDKIPEGETDPNRIPLTAPKGGNKITKSWC